MRFPLLFFVFLFGATTAGLSQNNASKLRQETRLDDLYAQYDLHGGGVIVALIERGIDYRHPDFIDAAGRTRIAYIFDLTDASGANDPDNPYGVGTIYDRTEIDQALQSGNHLPQTDRHGHGIACTGIAAGDGSGLPGAPYRGVADKATIIAVKILNDPFPPTGNLPGQAGFYDPDLIPPALQFVKDKSAELALPSVALMNLGSLGGPSDGTSKISREMAAYPGAGRLLVCGSGDDGGGDNRAAGTVMAGDTSILRINKAEVGNLRFECWHDGDDRFDVFIRRPNGTVEGAFTSPATNNDFDRKFLTQINYYHNGADRDFDQATNGQRQIMIDFSGANGVYEVGLIGKTISNGAYTASLNPSLYRNNNGFLNQVVPNGSINDFATTPSVIVPTDYVLDPTWTDLDGIPRARQNEGAPGEIWAGSSAGPTRDGRLGVDVAVPGEVLIGAYSPNTFYAQFPFNMVDSLYGIQNAVSAAAPVLTGALALMLEVQPDLTQAEAKQILQQTARADGFTGTVPNVVWGYGKFDALAAIEATRQLRSLESLRSMGWRIGPNPVRDVVRFTRTRPDRARVQVIEPSGRVVRSVEIYGTSGSLSLEGLAPGLYVLRIAEAAGTAFSRILKP